MNKNTKDLTIYCDMDGVIANFSKEHNGLIRFENETGFFKKLEPFRENLNAVKEMIEKGYDVRILSTSPNEQADKDKKAWLRVYLPQMLAEKMIFTRPQKHKIDYIPQEQRYNAVLIDDYGVNTRAWENGGGIAVKIDPIPKNELEFTNVQEFLKVLDTI